MKHVLSLEVIDTLNPIMLRVSDTSIYHPNVPIECMALDITLPGFTQSTRFVEPDLTKNFNLNLTSCDLEIQIEECGDNYKNLPDGIYVLKYMVSPREIVYVEYNHLRTTEIRNIYNRILCNVPLQGAAPTKEIEQQLNYLKEADMYIKAAKVKVEIAHEPEKGMELYAYAKKILSKFDCKSCY